MQQRLPSLFANPILFAHRGASAHAIENSSEAFQLAIRLGATGIETDCWVTSDNVVVLDHDGVVKGGITSLFRTKKIRELSNDELDPAICRFSEMMTIAQPTISISVDICDPSAMGLIDGMVRSSISQQNIYICHPDINLLKSWKQSFPNFKYVNSIRLKRIGEGVERRCADLAQFGIDVLNMHYTDWNGGLVTLAHRFGLAAFSWDLQHTEQISTALLMGVDAVYSDWTDRMIDANNQIFGSQ